MKLRKPRRWIERLVLKHNYGLVVECEKHGRSQYHDAELGPNGGYVFPESNVEYMTKPCCLFAKVKPT